MKRIVLAALLALAPAAASAQLLEHNGSIMEAVPFGNGGLEIRYLQPRPGLWPVGVRPGTALVRGHWRGPWLEATAVVFSANCGPVPYAVRGAPDPAGVLVLSGPAPIVDPWRCSVLGMAWTLNANLVFMPVR